MLSKSTEKKIAQKNKDLDSVRSRISFVKKQPETLKRASDLDVHYAREAQLEADIQKLEAE